MNLKRNPKVSKKIFCYLRGGCKEGNYIHRNLKGGSKNGRTFGNGKKLPPVTTIVSMGISIVSTITVISVPGFGFSFWGSFRGSFGFSVSGSLSTIVMSVPSFGFSISLRFSNSGGFSISGAFSQVTVSVSISVGVSIVSAISEVSSVVSGITTIVMSVPGFGTSLGTGFGLRFCYG